MKDGAAGAPGAKRPKVLFVCTAIGARAILAAGFLERFARGEVEVFSSGFEEGEVPESIVRPMKGFGLAPPGKAPRTVFDRYRSGEAFDFVVTLCSDEQFAHCPVFLNSVGAVYGERAMILHWKVPDFRSIKGTGAQWTDRAREIAAAIEAKVEQLGGSLVRRF